MDRCTYEARRGHARAMICACARALFVLPCLSCPLKMSDGGARKLVIGSRESELAMVQTREVEAAVKVRGHGRCLRRPCVTHRARAGPLPRCGGRNQDVAVPWRRGTRGGAPWTVPRRHASASRLPLPARCWTGPSASWPVKTLAFSPRNLRCAPRPKCLAARRRGGDRRCLQRWLLASECDVAVHSLKDMPTTLPDGLVLAAITKVRVPSAGRGLVLLATLTHLLHRAPCRTVSARHPRTPFWCTHVTRCAATPS